MTANDLNRPESTRTGNENPSDEQPHRPVMQPRFWDIIRLRWAEVVMLIVLYAGLMVWVLWLYNDLMQDEKSVMRYLSLGRLFIIGLVTSSYFFIVESLLLGFMASTVYEGARQQEPMVLLRAGRYYLWRWIRYQFAIGFLMFLIMMACISLIQAAVPHTNVEATQEIPGWMAAMGMSLSLLILMKISLLIPADMIVHNRMVWVSFQSMRNYSLWSYKGLIGLYILWQGGMIVQSLILPDRPPDWIVCAVWTSHAIWFSVGRFVTMLKSVLDVKSQSRQCRI